MYIQCFTMYSHWLSVFIICEANDSRSESSKGLFTEIQCITIVSLCPLNNPREGIFSPVTSLSFFFTMSLPPWRFQCMTLICTMQVKRNSPTSYGQARNILGDDYYLPRQRKKKRQESRLDALLGHCSSPLSEFRGQSRCQRVTTRSITLPLYI